MPVSILFPFQGGTDPSNPAFSSAERSNSFSDASGEPPVSLGMTSSLFMWSPAQRCVCKPGRLTNEAHLSLSTW